MEIEDEYDRHQCHLNDYQNSHNSMQLETQQQQSMQNENEQNHCNGMIHPEYKENELSTQECGNTNQSHAITSQKELGIQSVATKKVIKDSFSVYSINSQISSSSSSSSSVKRRKASNNSFDIESAHSQSSGDFSRQADYRVQPIYRLLFPKSYVHIFGDMIIHTDINNLEDYIGINSPFNQIKKIQQIVYNKLNKTLELSLDNTNTTFIDFDNLIHLFSNYPEKTIHELGINLDRYKNYSLKQQKMIQICAKQEGYQEFTRLKQVKFDRFRTKAMEIVDQYQDEYICYIIFQRNYETGGLEMKKVGINEKLILLLGTNVNDYEELVRRVGMYCFQNKFIYNYIFSKYIEQMGERIRRSEFDNAASPDRGIEKAISIEYQTSMLTIDDFVVESNITLETYVDCSDEDANISQDLLKFRDMFHMFRIQISDETINTLKTQRQGSQTTHMDIIQKESLYYELEASVFLEKFYGPKKESNEDLKKKQVQQEIEKQKTCGFRVIS